MVKKARLPQTRRHILVYNEDWEYLETRFGADGIRPFGISNVIRSLIHQRVTTWREAENAALDAKRRASVTETHEPSPGALPHGIPTNIDGSS